MKTQGFDIKDFCKATVINLDFVKPFTEKSRYSNRKQRTLGYFRKHAGCYIIKEDDRIVYVGMSGSDVVEACYRHLYDWNDRNPHSRHLRITYAQQLRLGSHQYEISIITTRPDQAAELERSLILFLNPRDNRERYEDVIRQLLEKHGYKERENAFVEDPSEPEVIEDLPF